MDLTWVQSCKLGIPCTEVVMELSSHAVAAIEPEHLGNAFQKLLVAIDFSKSSSAALAYAENLAKDI